MSEIDFNSPPSKYKYSSWWSGKNSGERKVRLFKDVVLFVVAVGFVITLAAPCVRTVSSPTASADEKKRAMSILSAATGGIIGYLVGN